jgi:ribosomal protein L40E
VNVNGNENKSIENNTRVDCPLPDKRNAEKPVESTCPSISVNTTISSNAKDHAVIRFCRKCGAVLAEGAIACSHCGTMIIREDYQ